MTEILSMIPQNKSEQIVENTSAELLELKNEIQEKQNNIQILDSVVVSGISKNILNEALGKINSILINKTINDGNEKYVYTIINDFILNNKQILLQFAIKPYYDSNDASMMVVEILKGIEKLSWGNKKIIKLALTKAPSQEILQGSYGDEIYENLLYTSKILAKSLESTKRIKMKDKNGKLQNAGREYIYHNSCLDVNTQRINDYLINNWSDIINDIMKRL